MPPRDGIAHFAHHEIGLRVRRVELAGSRRARDADGLRNGIGRGRAVDPRQ
jgi:hypothetical protein